MPQTQDYRSSHLNRGLDYDDLFQAGGYPHLLWSFERAIITEVIEQRFEGKPFRHLDVACGTGRILAHVQGLSTKSFGVDISPSMLRTAQTRTRNAVVIRGDFAAPSPPFAGKFDVITCFRFFLNADPWLRKSVAANARALLADRGLFVFNNHRNYHSLTYRMLRAAGKSTAELACMTHEEASELIANAGLRIVRIYHVGFVPGTDHKMYLPYELSARVESIAIKVSALRRFANDLVYVCERASHA
jgi:SAM-dependent methyltransferase